MEKINLTGAKLWTLINEAVNQAASDCFTVFFDEGKSEYTAQYEIMYNAEKGLSCIREVSPYGVSERELRGVDIPLVTVTIDLSDPDLQEFIDANEDSTIYADWFLIDAGFGDVLYNRAVDKIHEMGYALSDE